MMGFKEFQEKFFYNFSLSKRIPDDHLLKQLEATIDLSFVRELTALYYSHTGQPSVDPVVLFKMMLLGYLYGITSERRLAEEISLNLAFMWYIGYDLDEPTPNHSVISKARARYGKEVFEEFFSRVLRLCMEVGLIKGEKIFADSTLIDANASLKSIRLRQDAVEPRYTAKEFIEKVFKENPLEQEGQEEPVKEEFIEKDEGRMKLLGERKVRISNKTHASLTDPEASLVARPKRGLMIAYKDHFTVNESRVITAVKVTPAAVEDSTVVDELLARQPVKPKEFCADTHYGVPEVYEELLSRGIQPVIPRRSPTTRKPKAGRISTDEFRYLPDKDVFICPKGKELKRVAYEKKWRRYHYRPKVKECRGCALRGGCATERSVRTLLRYEEGKQKAVDFAVEYLKTPEGKKTFSERPIFAEWTVAEAKGLHGLRRAMFRGLEKVTIQALMIATVQNIKRLLKHLGEDNRGSQTLRYRYLLQWVFHCLILWIVRSYFAEYNKVS